MTDEALLSSVQTLTERVTQLLDVASIKPKAGFELPKHLPGAFVAPRKLGTSLPEVLAKALDEHCRLSGMDKNAVLAESLLQTLPADVINWAIQEMLAEARRMWSLTDPGQQLTSGSG